MGGSIRYVKQDVATQPKLLLHACCGPCTLEPFRILVEEGFEPVVFYANPNIEPHEEYVHRLETLKTWADENGVPVVEAPYDNEAWRERVANQTFDERAERCRACYRVRLEESAAYALEHGFEALGTTLSVSPYQHTEIIHEELDRVCAETGLTAVFEDYRPYYPEATERSRALGMYRQNYCGCALSEAEAAAERAARKEQRAAEREAYRAEHAEEIAAQEQALAEKRAAKQAYAEKQARKHAILQEARAARKAAEAAQTELHGDVFADAEKPARTTEEGTA